MPHPEREHELQIALATAIRERDEALAQETYWHNRATEARDELAAALRAAELSALERAAQVADRNADTYGAGIGMIANRGTAKEIRALASPAAAPEDSK